MSWQQRAGCAGRSTHLFFPMATSGPAGLQTQEAKDICADCPVSIAACTGPSAPGPSTGSGAGSPRKNGEPWKRRHLRCRPVTRTDLLGDLLPRPEARAAATAHPQRHAVLRSP